MALNAAIASIVAVVPILGALTAEANAADARVAEWRYLLTDKVDVSISRNLIAFGYIFPSDFRVGNGSSPPTVVYVGDSLTFGYGGTYPYNHYIALPACNGIPFASYNIGINAETLQTMKSIAPSNLNSLFAHNAPVNIAVIWGGTNDIANGVSAAQAFFYLQTFAKDERALGFRIIVATMISRVGLDSQKDAYNALIRENWPNFADGLADLAANPNLGADGAYSNRTYFQSDRIHLTDMGYSLVGSIFQAALGRLITGRTENISTACKVGIDTDHPL